MLSADEWAAFRRNLESFARLPTMRDYWRRESEIYTDAFRDALDRILRELAEEPRMAPKSVILPKAERRDG